MLSSFPSYFLLSSSSRDLDPLSLPLLPAVYNFFLFPFFFLLLVFLFLPSASRFSTSGIPERFLRSLALYLCSRSFDLSILSAESNYTLQITAARYRQQTSTRGEEETDIGPVKRNVPPLLRLMNVIKRNAHENASSSFFFHPFFPHFGVQRISREFDPCPLKPTCKKSPFVNYLYRVLRILFHRLKLSDVKFFIHFYIRN